MLDAEHARAKGRGGWIVVAVLLSGLLVGCGRPLEVTAPAAAPARAATSTFQGAVTAIDYEGGTMAVAVQIVWAPVLEARAQDRQVVVDAFTQWEPEPGGIAQVHPGEEVQVEAEDALDGTWRATRVLLLDID